MSSSREKEVYEQAQGVIQGVGRIYLGRPDLIEMLLTALVAKGHLLLEGVPGVAKTTLVKAFAAALGAEFHRIQFTPDLLPADITGTYVFDMRDNVFHLRQGPIFANIVLADEVNRAPAKTQSAMLESMAEGQVTIEGESHPLLPPFMVLATQNPIEQEGVYPLPEAQVDRFLMKLHLDFPSRQVEHAILRTYRRTPEPVRPLLQFKEILSWQEMAEEIHVSNDLEEYILDLVSFTRNQPRVLLGASPRGTLGLLRASQARALLRGRSYVIPDDVRLLASPVMAHRLILRPEAELEGVLPQQIIKEALQRVPLVSPPQTAVASS